MSFPTYLSLPKYYPFCLWINPISAIKRVRMINHDFYFYLDPSHYNVTYKFPSFCHPPPINIVNTDGKKINGHHHRNKMIAIHVLFTFC